MRIRLPRRVALSLPFAALAAPGLAQSFPQRRASPALLPLRPGERLMPWRAISARRWRRCWAGLSWWKMSVAQAG